jgi:tetratricopeptide (TPR) repeat protein
VTSGTPPTTPDSAPVPPEPPAPSAWMPVRRLADLATAGVEGVQAVPWKAVGAVMVALLLVGYVIEGAGRTVIATLRVPTGSEQTLGDPAALTFDLIAEMVRVRTVQDGARLLRFDLAKGLESNEPGGMQLDLDLSVNVNADYKRLIEHLGTVKMEWGPIQVPADALLRPLQWIIGQRVLEVAVERDGDGWRAFSSADDGRMWEATAAEGADRGACVPSRCLLRALASKMAFLDGMAYEPDDVWRAKLHLHDGARSLLDYARHRAAGGDGPRAFLEAARAHFEQAAALDPLDADARYDALLATFEQASYLPDGRERLDAYRELTDRVRAFLPVASRVEPAARRLLIAAYILRAETYRRLPSLEGEDFDEAVRSYEATLALLPVHHDLRTYALNNLGFVYQRAKRFDDAKRSFEAATAGDPHYLPARVNLGALALDMRDYPSAERELLAVLRDAPDHLRALSNLGTLGWLVHADADFEDRLDARTRACVAEQALAGVRASIALLERAGLTRVLSSGEASDLAYRRRLAADLVQDAPAGGAQATPWTFRPCLDGNRHD